jgi:hypothetical protein
METGNLAIDAQAAFTRERRRSRRDRMVRWMLRRPSESTSLATLEQTLGGAPPASGRRLGLYAVPVCSIVGTAEPARVGVFDGRFRPPASSRRRWERLWIAGRRGAPLPPITLYRLGERHFVVDGHHRLSVAKALGMAAIDAEVTELGL